MQPRGRARTIFAWVVAALITVGVGIAGCEGSRGATPEHGAVSSYSTTSTAVGPTSPEAVAGSLGIHQVADGNEQNGIAAPEIFPVVEEPVRVLVPRLGIDAPLVRVGLLEGGDMEVPPFGWAGWYELGPKPGDPGPAVIVGHVDNRKGPDVFFRLKELGRGDEVLVYGEHGGRVRFVVEFVEQQPKGRLPVERIWGDTREPVIRLITCGGEFDRKSRHYLANVIAYGSRVE